MDKIADLHIHSFYSDGTLSPDEILEIAVEKGVGLLAITDHDILDGSLELLKINQYDIKCVSGVELDALDNKMHFHVLGYGIDLSNQHFYDFVKYNRELLEQVSVRLIEKMQNDYSYISVSDYDNFAYDKRKGGWKALHYFLDRGVANNYNECFMLYSKYNCLHNSVAFPEVSEVCKQIHNAGGVAILAHPGKMINHTDINQFKNELDRVVHLGVDGIECYYPSHTKEITDVCLEVCEENDLLITCGSDCHGEFEKNEIGEMKIPIKKLKLNGIL